LGNAIYLRFAVFFFAAFFAVFFFATFLAFFFAAIFLCNVLRNTNASHNNVCKLLSSTMFDLMRKYFSHHVQLLDHRRVKFLSHTVQ